MEFRAKKCQRQIKITYEQSLTQENIKDIEREKKANMLFNNLNFNQNFLTFLFQINFLITYLLFFHAQYL